MNFWVFIEEGLLICVLFFGAFSLFVAAQKISSQPARKYSFPGEEVLIYLARKYSLSPALKYLFPVSNIDSALVH